MRFAPDHDVPIPYMQRTRDYYLRLGFDNPYRWAHYDEVPFTPLAKPLAQSRLALITTAAPYQPGMGDQGPGAKYNAAAKFYTVYSDSTDSVPDLRISHVGYDRKHTTRRGREHVVPARAPPRGGQGGAARRAHAALPRRADEPEPAGHDRDATRRSSWRAAARTGRTSRCSSPPDPCVTRPSSLVARHLEANGIPTVIMGAAKDIVEHCGVPRFLFSDFPLGNSAGKPFDVESQAATLELALRLLESAPAPRTTVQSPQRWSDDAAWKLDYSNLDQLTPEEIAEKRREFDVVKAVIASKPDRT